MFTNYKEGCKKGKSENGRVGEMAKLDDTKSQ